LELFGGLPEEDLDRLCQMSEPISIRSGDYLMRQSVPTDSLWVVVDGELEVVQSAGQRELVIAQRGPGDILGETSLLSQSPPLASVRAVRDSRLLSIGQAAFESLLVAHPSTMRLILRTVTTRLRDTEALLQQSERLAALGTLAAGLAHELNNPAAAARSAAAQLRDVLGPWLRAGSDLSALGVDPTGVVAAEPRAETAHRGSRAAVPDPLAIADLEAELQAWLEGRGVEDAWELAPPLIAAGWDLVGLGRLADRLPDAPLSGVVRWVARDAALGALLDELAQGTSRISEIVQAVRTYSYLDRGPAQEVDVNEGIENTLVVLRHRLPSGVTVSRGYDPDLPRLAANGGELNQVWTNLIDNALDAMGDAGELTVSTRREGDHVVVGIGDTGPGILPEIQPRIFEPFFTTKPPGSGTGLGLHVAHNIVVLRHRGQIRVESVPGRTVFEVRLPIEPERREEPRTGA
jgi:signal transduction histidine kinase